MMPVTVRTHLRRHAPAHPSPRRKKPISRKRALERMTALLGGSVDTAIADIEAGRRKGFTWAGGYKFDIDSPESMDALYESLRLHGIGVIYVVARTNRTLAEWRARGSPRDIGWNFGLGAWTDDDGTVYVDDIFVQDYPRGEDSALALGRKYRQKFILKVDAAGRAVAFLPTGADAR